MKIFNTLLEGNCWGKKKKAAWVKNEFKIPEKSLSCDKNIEEYHKCKTDLGEIYDNIAEGVKIRSKCQCYKENEKSTKYFLNLEEKHAEKSTIWRLVTDKKDLVKYNDINNEISLTSNQRTDRIDKLNHNTLLESISLPSVTNDQKVVCHNGLTDKELFDALKGIPDNKSPGDDVNKGIQ